jgi:MoaA/NifB/PqqE/SkfB family radical SAM enzyme
VRRRSPVVGGFRAAVLRLLLLGHVLWLGLRLTGHPGTVLRRLGDLRRTKQQVAGGTKLRKLVRAGKGYLAGLNLPVWPSLAFSRFVEGEYRGHRGDGSDVWRLQTLVFGITSRCPLRCRHCFASGLLSETEYLSFEQLQEILHRFQERGVAQVQWSGGEPLERFEDMVRLTEGAQPDTDFWVLTSGYGLTADKARTMRRAGIRGVNVSLDHWDPEQHNAFRGSDEAFFRAVSAVRVARECGLLVCLSLCATKQFVSEANLARYMRLSSDLGVGFVQILEARAIGSYAGQDVALSEEQLQALERCFLRSNRGRAGRRMPMVVYHGYHQRRFGCFGGGDRFLYVDPRGDVYPCPFSPHRLGNALSGALVPAQVRCEVHCDRFVQAGKHPELLAR